MTLILEHGTIAEAVAPSAAIFDRGNWRSSWLHVRAVSLAERKIDAELRIELSEFVQAYELAIATRAGAHIERYAKLVARSASNPRCSKTS